MARAVAECTCVRCGKTFEKIRYCLPNRAAADSFEEWAKECCTLCPDCYREQQKENNARQAAVLIDELHLPQITGKSAKQIQFAGDLRNKALASNPDVARHIADWFRRADAGELDARAAELHKTPAELIQDSCNQSLTYSRLYTVLTTGEARQLIDTLKY